MSFQCFSSHERWVVAASRENMHVAEYAEEEAEMCTVLFKSALTTGEKLRPVAGGREKRGFSRKSQH